MGDDLRDKTEIELLTLAKAGDHGAWSQLIAPRRPRLLQAVRKLVKNEAEAEDLVQETLMTMYVEFQQFRGESRYYTYIWAAAQRKALNWLRDEANRRKLLKKHSVQDTYNSGPGMGAPPLTPEAVAAGRESLAIAGEMIAGFSPDEQGTLLRTINDDEATEPSVPVANPVAERVALHRVRSKLRRQFTLLDKKEEDQ